MEPKLPSESRTIGLAVIVMIISLAGAIPETVAFIQKFATDNPVEWTDAVSVVPWILLLAKGLVDIWLRFATKSPIVWSK